MAITVDEDGFPIDTSGAKGTSPATNAGRDPEGYLITQPATPSAEVPFPPAPPALPSILSPGGQAQRVIGAAKEGYYGAPSFWSPQAWAEIQKSGPVLNALAGLPDTALALGSGLFRGGQQLVSEITGDVLSPANPLLKRAGMQPAASLARDVAAGPEAFAGSPGDISSIPLPERAAPGYSPASSAAADAAAKYRYDYLKSSGLTFASDLVDSALDSVQPTSPRELARETTTGRTPVSDALDNLNTFRGQPMTIQQYQGMMEGLNARIRTLNTTDPSAAGQLRKIQSNLKDAFESAAPENISSGDIADMTTFKDANKSYQQARKMEDIEQMQATANRTSIPTTSFQSQVRAFLKNDNNTEGWTAEEKAALDNAADRGASGALMHLLGSRLPAAVATAIPLALEAYGTGGAPTAAGLASGVLSGTTAYGLSELFRQGGGLAAKGRIQNALDVMGQSAPSNPLLWKPPPLPPSTSPFLPWR